MKALLPRTNILNKAKHEGMRHQWVFNTTDTALETLKRYRKTLQINEISYMWTFNERTRKHRLNINPSSGFKENVATSAHLKVNEEFKANHMNTPEQSIERTQAYFNPSPAFLGWYHDEMVFKAHDKWTKEERDRLLLGEWK